MITENFEAISIVISDEADRLSRTLLTSESKWIGIDPSSSVIECAIRYGMQLQMSIEENKK